MGVTAPSSPKSPVKGQRRGGWATSQTSGIPHQGLLCPLYWPLPHVPAKTWLLTWPHEGDHGAQPLQSWSQDQDGVFYFILH